MATGAATETHIHDAIELGLDALDGDPGFLSDDL